MKKLVEEKKKDGSTPIQVITLQTFTKGKVKHSKEWQVSYVFCISIKTTNSYNISRIPITTNEQ